jgi:hypothetical protein
MWRYLAMALLWSTLGVAWAAAQDDGIPPGIKAGQEAYQQAEAERRAAAGAQVELNHIMRSRVPWSSPYGDTIYYAPPAYAGGPGYSALGTNITMHRPYGYQPQSYLGATAMYGPGTYIPYPSLFAYAYPPPVIRQPIGQRQVQTGPRRWESYPIYGDEPDPASLPAPAERPAAERVREPEPPPAPMEFKAKRGPREF